jgi:hypothetical protein
MIEQLKNPTASDIPLGLPDEPNPIRDAWHEKLRAVSVPATLLDVKEVFKKWLYFDEDDEVIDVYLAACIDRKLKGDPFWLFLISASGGTKTEIVRSNRTELAYTLDSLSSHSLVSGKLKRDEEGNQIPIMGILPEIDGKVLIIKDFTLILKKRPEERDEIFSQLRCLYDGYIECAFGTMDKPVSIKAKIGLIAAVTPAIDQYSNLYVQLGERFLKIRHNPDKEKATAKAMENLGQETEMREELELIIQRFLLPFTTPQPDSKEPIVKPVSKEQLSEIQKMAMATAVLRTPVSMRIWRGEVSDIIPVSVEYPTRLSKQLLKAAYALSIVRGKTEVTTAEIDTVRRLARDTGYPNRIKIIQAMELTYEYKTREVSERTKIPLSTCWRELKELEYLDVVCFNKKHDTENDGWTLKNTDLKAVLPK